MRKHRYSLWLVVVVILLGITTCKPKEGEMPFETIEQGDYSEGYDSLKPQMVFVISQQQADLLEGLISQEALEKLAKLDFQQSFAIAVFRGRKPSGGYTTIIERVARQGDKIVVYAQFWEPSPYYEVQQEATSPYHLIRVQRDGYVSLETMLVLQSPLITPTPPSR